MADIVAPHRTFATYLTDPGHPDPPVSESLFINLFEGYVKENFVKSILFDEHLTTKGYLM